MRVETFLCDSVRRFPDKTFVVAGGERISYAAMADRVNRLAGALRESGVARGDRVVVFADTSVLTVTAIFACLKAGAVVSPIHPAVKTEKLAFILNNCRATAVVTPAALLPTTAEAITRAPSVVVTVVDDPPGGLAVRGVVRSMAEVLAAPSPAEVAPAGIDIDLAMIVYTSGSTGVPKGVMLTHQNVVTTADSIISYLENTDADVILNALPLSFGYGLYQVLTAARVGATVVLERSFAFPVAILKAMRRERVTGCPLVPTMVVSLLQLKDLPPGGLPDLRYLTNAAAALPTDHIRRLLGFFPRVRLYSMYGQTECQRCTYLPPDQLAVRPDSVGKAIPNTEAYLVDDRGERVGPGEVGELVVRGGHVMKGYWEDPAATARALRPGPHPWEKVLHTGDLFRADADGYLYFVARKDDIIKTRGEKVSPKEVENVLYTLPGVQEAAVVGVPDPVLGAVVKAVIVPADGAALSERGVVAHCAAHLEDYMVPRQVEFVCELPKTDNGKIRRSQVQAEAAAACAARVPRPFPERTEPAGASRGPIACTTHQIPGPRPPR